MSATKPPMRARVINRGAGEPSVRSERVSGILRNNASSFTRSVGRHGLAMSPSRAGDARAFALGAERVGAERDDAKILSVRAGFEDPCGFPAIETRKRQIHQDDVGVKGARFVERLVTVTRRLDTKPRELEVVRCISRASRSPRRVKREVSPLRWSSCVRTTGSAQSANHAAASACGTTSCNPRPRAASECTEFHTPRLRSPLLSDERGYGMRRTCPGLILSGSLS